MKKVVLISCVFPDRLDTGKKIVINGIMTYLLDVYGEKNFTYIHIGGDQELSRKYSWYLTLPLSHTLLRLMSVIWHSFIRKDKAIQESILFSRDFEQKINALVLEINPDLIVCDTIRIGQFFLFDTPYKKILYLEDLFSIRYKKILEQISANDVRLDPLGNFKKFIPVAFHRFISNNKLIQKQLLSREKYLVESSEKEFPSYFEESLLINRDEVAALKKQISDRKISEIKPYLIDNLEAPFTRKFKGRPLFLFIGDLNVPHNRFAVVNIIRDIVPEAVKVIPDLEVNVIGNGVDNELLSEAEKLQNHIKLLGYVDDINDYLSVCAAVLIPLSFGTGVKLKTLVSLKKGIPVISTDYGVEGINVTNFKECIIENKYDKYPSLMKSIMDSTFNTEMSKNSKLFYEQNYSKSAIYKEYAELFY